MSVKSDEMVYSSMKANLNFRKQVKYLADDHWIIEYDSYKTWTLDHKFLFVTQSTIFVPKSQIQN